MVFLKLHEAIVGGPICAAAPALPDLHLLSSSCLRCNLVGQRMYREALCRSSDRAQWSCSFSFLRRWQEIASCDSLGPLDVLMHEQDSVAEPPMWMALRASFWMALRASLWMAVKAISWKVCCRFFPRLWGLCSLRQLWPYKSESSG